MKFSELSQDIQISSGGTILLRCVTSLPVEQCRWSLTPVNSNTTVVVKQFPAAGSESRDCSVRLSHALAEQEGLWTCGARIHGRENYTDAPPAKLSLLEPGIIESWEKDRRFCCIAPFLAHTVEGECTPYRRFRSFLDLPRRNLETISDRMISRIFLQEQFLFRLTSLDLRTTIDIASSRLITEVDNFNFQ